MSHSKFGLSTAAPLILLGLLWPAPLDAQPERPFSLEVAFWPEISYSNDDGLDVETGPLGLRGTWRLSETWALEGGLTAYNLGGERGDELRLDVSARRRLLTAGKTELFALAGVGWLKQDLDGQLKPFETDSFTAHVGVGWEIPLSRRFYFRPDLRSLWVEDEGRIGGEDFDLEGSAAFGLRF